VSEPEGDRPRALGEAALERLLAAEPTTLAALERAIGPLARGVEEAWALARTGPALPLAPALAELTRQGGDDRRSGFAGGAAWELTVAFAGDPGVHLRTVDDPRVARARVRAPGTDAGAIAAGVRGAGHPAGDHVAWGGAAGTYRVYAAEPDRLVWELADPPFAATRSSSEVAALNGQLVALVSAPLHRGIVERAFGPLAMDGRGPDLYARGGTWKLVVRPIDRDPPREVELQLEPPLAAVPIVAALGWDDAHVVPSPGGALIARRREVAGTVVANNRVELYVQGDRVDDARLTHARLVPVGRGYPTRSS
jgi:hypothetical protein